MTSHTEKECKNVKIELSHQEEKIVSGPLGKNSFKIMFVMLLIATICIMLYYMNEIKDPNPNNNVWDMFAFTFFITREGQQGRFLVIQGRHIPPRCFISLQIQRD